MKTIINQYEILGKAVSVNSVAHARGYRQASQRVTINPWKESIIIQMKAQGCQPCTSEWLLGIATIHMPHNNRADADNYIKYLQDGVAEALQIDDGRFASFWVFLKKKSDGATEYKTELSVLEFREKITAPDPKAVAKLFKVR